MKFKDISRELYLGAKGVREGWHEGAYITNDALTATIMLTVNGKEPSPYRELLGELAMADSISADDWKIVGEAKFKNTREFHEYLKTIDKPS